VDQGGTTWLLRASMRAFRVRMFLARFCTILTIGWLSLSQAKAEETTVRTVRPDPTSLKQFWIVRPTYPLGLPSDVAIRRVELPPSRKVIALTFDLCEGGGERAGYDEPIVDYLQKEKIRATFFAGGKWMHDHPGPTLQLMADPLFEIGNHSWSHANMRRATGQRVRDQIVWTQAQYAFLREELMNRSRQQGVATPERMRIPSVPLTFRFPYGVCSSEALTAVTAAGLPAIQWDVVSGDPDRHQTAARMTATVLRQAKPGSIVVFHANGRGYWTAQALPQIVARLREQGFQFVTVSEMLQLAVQTGGTVSAASDCYEHRPGDNRRYDQVKRKGRRP
jgi:peptidoglycan-N-acetylglucosamine deacetylase